MTEREQPTPQNTPGDQPTPPDPTGPQVPAEPVPSGAPSPAPEDDELSELERGALGDLGAPDVEAVAASYGNSGKFHTTDASPTEVDA